MRFVDAPFTRRLIFSGQCVHNAYDSVPGGVGTGVMTAEATLREVIGRLGRAIETLENAAATRLERDQESVEAEAEVQRMNADRAKLAQELDNSEARAERLENANKEVSRRLVTAMETIRAVLDR
jgi:hypothetical protein